MQSLELPHITYMNGFMIFHHDVQSYNRLELVGGFMRFECMRSRVRIRVNYSAHVHMTVDSS